MGLADGVSGQLRPPSVVRTAPPSNLPGFTMPFVGREEELEEAAVLLEGSRLLTITGFGGIGKTRFAVELAGRLAGRYPDGVWIVQLSHLDDPDQVARVAADELGVGGGGDPFRVASTEHSTAEELLRFLEERRALLILDHCERVVTGAAALAASVLGRCPALTLLSTSQQPLRIPGERTWTLPPLRVAAEGDSSAAAASDAVRLFATRAAAADPQFTLDADTTAIVSRICRRLDGSPLAIELAAARTDVLDVAEIADRLDDRFRLLGADAGPEHSRTLEATVEWSFESLDHDERLAFARLSVFPGSFTADGAEAVVPGGEIAAGDVVGLLSSLLAKSVLMRSDPDAGRHRYRLPQTLRTYAEERLAEMDDPAARRRAHAVYYLSFAATRAEPLDGTHQTEALNALESEHHNLHTALERSIDDGDAATALGLVASLAWTWFIRDQPESLGLAERALAMPAAVDPEIRSRAAIGTGLLLATHGRVRRARGLLTEARRERADAGDRLAVARADLYLGLASYVERDLDGAEERFGAALQSLEDQEVGLGVAWANWFLAWVARDRHEWDRAARLVGSSLRAFRALEEPFGLANALADSGTLARHRGDLDAARRDHAEALEIFRSLDNRTRIIQVLGSLGIDERDCGNHAAALAHFEEAIDLAARFGARAAEAEGRYLAGQTHQRAGRETQAEEAFMGAVHTAAETDEAAARHTVVLALEALAEIAGRRGHFGRAVRLTAAAHRRREDLGRPASGHHRQRVNATLVEARSHLSDDAYERLYAGGRAMDDAHLLAAVFSPDDPAAGAETAITLEQVEMGERVARQLEGVGDRRSVRLAGIRVAGRRRRPTGESPPLPVELSTSGWIWLGLGIITVGIWLTLFTWPETTAWWDARDATVNEWFVEVRTDVLSALARAVHALGSPWFWRPLRWLTLIVLALVAKRWRHFFAVILAVLAVGFLADTIAVEVARPRPFVPIIGTWHGYSHPSGPVADLAVTLAAAGFALVPRGRARQWFLIGSGALVGALVVARVYLGVDHLSDGVVSAMFAPAVTILVFRLWAPESVFPVAYRRGKTAHLDVGGARGRAIIRAMSDQLGITVTAAEPVGLGGSGGSTPLRMCVAGDPPTELFAKLYARNHLRADRWYKTGRTILYGALEDEVSFRSVRRLVEYEDYMLLTMWKANIPCPRPFGVVEITPNREYLIVTEFLSDAVELGDVDPDPGIIDDALSIVRRLWDEGLAHRDIKPSNLMVAEGRVWLVDVSFGLVRPTPWRQAVDLANMMLVLSLRADPELVYERALQFFAPEDIAEAFAATRGITVPRQLSAALKARLRDDGVDRIARFCELAPAAEPISVQRWSARRIGLTLGALLAGLLLASLIVENLQGRGFL